MRHRPALGGRHAGLVRTASPTKGCAACARCREAVCAAGAAPRRRPRRTAPAARPLVPTGALRPPEWTALPATHFRAALGRRSISASCARSLPTPRPAIMASSLGGCSAAPRTCRARSLPVGPRTRPPSADTARPVHAAPDPCPSAPCEQPRSPPLTPPHCAVLRRTPDRQTRRDRAALGTRLPCPSICRTRGAGAAAYDAGCGSGCCRAAPRRAAPRRMPPSLSLPRRPRARPRAPTTGAWGRRAEHKV